MTEKERARRAARRRQALVSFTPANTPEHNSSITDIQAARIAQRFVLSGALARTIAEHAFQNGGRAHG